MENNNLREFIKGALKEDVGDGDHTSLACIPANATGKAHLLIKDKGILSGVRIAAEVFSIADSHLKFEPFIDDGSHISYGDIAFIVTGRQQSILISERLVLNIMQRMSGIATNTFQYTKQLEGLKTRILDTRKTTPGFRWFEKEAVKTGGGVNYRMGLYDMIMLKDNHIAYAGGIEKAILQTKDYLKKKNMNLSIVIEAGTINDVRTIMSVGGVDRIMLDNFSVEETREAVRIIDREYETESSGGITLENIRSYAECGVDFISVGALTHHIKSLDMSLKAI